MRKPLRWLADEIAVPAVSAEAASKVGAMLEVIAMGGTIAMPRCRPMPSIGRRCHELRVRDRNRNWRIVYHVADDAIVILDVFSKKSPRTPSHVIDRCKQRLKRYEQSY